MTVIANRYEIERSIGIGGMAEVFLATDQLLGRRVAIKVLNRAYAEQPAFVERFKREAQATAALDHPNIVPIYDWGETDDSYYIAMAYVEGETLSARLRAHGQLPEADVVRWMAGVAGALHTAHERGIVHRDIKPHNILLDESGQPRVTDFGIAQATGLSPLTDTSVVLGTATYVSPEQASRGEIDQRSDIYSLGIVAYELLAGRPPFQGESIVELAVQHVNESPRRLRALRPEISPATEQVVMTCLEKSPDDRFQSAAELKEAFERALHLPGKAGPEAGTVAVTASGPTRVMSSANVADFNRAPRSRDGSPAATRFWWAGVAIAAIALIGILAFIVGQFGDTDIADTNGPGGQQGEIAAPEPTEPPTTDQEQPTGDEVAETPVPETDPENEDTEPADDVQPEEAPVESGDETPPANAAQPIPESPGTFTCDGAFEGGTAESVRVPGNAHCTLTGVRINNDVALQPGATLQAADIEIYGNIEARNATALELLGSSFVDGNIEFEESGELRVTGATITGNLRVEENAGHVTIEGNRIEGNLRARGNLGGITISSNWIDGNLECETNDPPPTGGNNTVDGNMEDQCEGL